MATTRNKAKQEERAVETVRDQNIKSWIEDLESASDLNEWEQNFLASVTEWWTDKGFLTEGQFNKLKQVWDRHQR